MNITTREKRIGQFFRLSVILKGLHAVFEILGGLLLIFISPQQAEQFVRWVTQDELMEDAHDLVANYLLHISEHLSVSSFEFGVFYLLSHGIIKLVLVIALLKNKLWAYPWSLIVLTLFVIYQIYRFTFTYSVGLIFLTLFDLVVIWLIWSEYQIVRRHLAE